MFCENILKKRASLWVWGLKIQIRRDKIIIVEMCISLGGGILILYSPVVTICTASLTFNNSTFYPHSVCMCFVWI